jgi:hypothetical protein
MKVTKKIDASELSRARFNSTHAMRTAGASNDDIAVLLGISVASVKAYMKHDSFEKFRDYNTQQSIKRSSKNDSKPQKVSPVNASMEPFAEAISATQVEAISMDVVARTQIEALTNDIHGLEERLKWLEANAVISNTRRNLWRK